MTEICAECYEATKDVIRADPAVLREEVGAWIACGLFDDAVRARWRELGVSAPASCGTRPRPSRRRA